MSTILCTNPVESPTAEILGEFGTLVTAPKDDEETLCSLAGDAIVIVGRGNSKITAKLMDAAPNLKVIGRTGVGFDMVDIAAATERGIPVVITPNAPTNAVAEGVFAMLLHLVKRLNELTAAVQRGDWKFRLSVDIRDLEESTLGILGLGRIGRRVAELAVPFRMEILAYDPFVPQDKAPAGVRMVELDTLFREADYITVHTPLTDETHHIVNRERLALCKQGAVLINISRGPLVDTDAVYEALESGRLGGAGLDVFDQEPIDPSHPIVNHPRVTLAPHAIALSRVAKRRLFSDMSTDVATILRGGQVPLGNLANPEVYAANSKR
jgi:phosphoglycerate dehydrogenase-like enzyme